MNMKSDDLRLKHLERCFYEASIKDAKFVGVAIWTKGNEGLEIIINPNVNFDKKFDYYKKAYTEDLVLKTYDGIKIVGFTYGNTFEEIQKDLFRK